MKWISITKNWCFFLSHYVIINYWKCSIFFLTWTIANTVHKVTKKTSKLNFILTEISRQVVIEKKTKLTELLFSLNSANSFYNVDFPPFLKNFLNKTCVNKSLNNDIFQILSLWIPILHFYGYPKLKTIQKRGRVQ